METDIETKYCQTCGIPLDIDYNNLEVNTSSEYCDYCLKHGVKCYDFSMDYLIYLWGLFPEEYYKEVGISYTSQEIREVMSKRLPEIKRWKQKINTAHVLYELIVRVQEYINRHLFEELSLDALSQTAGISKYHFRRVFKAVCGENIGLYIQRLRLEYIAFKLISTNISVTELLCQINYQNKHTLSRAFKSYFKCTIPEFRKLHSNANPAGMYPVQIVPCIEKVPPVRIACLKLEWTEHINHDFTVLWKQILRLSENCGLQSSGCKFISLTLDCPLISSEEQTRFMVGITVPESFNVPNGFSVHEIEAGEYAVFQFKGLYHELNRVYRYIYLDWLPTSGYALREPYTFETYLNTPEKTPVSELRTDIYIPNCAKEQMNGLNKEIEQQLRNENADFVHFVDISMLDIRQNRGFPYALLIGIAINPHFIKTVHDSPDYVHTLSDEYAQAEKRVGMIADKLAGRLISKGYKALSQSDNALITENTFDFATKTSILPHKTIAVLSGIGYIGKNNLFITAEYGAAQCLGSVLTNAPLSIMEHEIKSSQCGNCNICRDVCPQKALNGVVWNMNVSRDEIVNVYDCVTCLKCLVYCPKTQAYMKRHITMK